MYMLVDQENMEVFPLSEHIGHATTEARPCPRIRHGRSKTPVSLGVFTEQMTGLLVFLRRSQRSGVRF